MCLQVAVMFMSNVTPQKLLYLPLFASALVVSNHAFNHQSAQQALTTSTCRDVSATFTAV